MSLFFYLFTFSINLCDQKFVTADVTAVLVKINPVFTDENKILIKNTQIYPAYTVTRVDELKSMQLKCIVCIFFHMG